MTDSPPVAKAVLFLRLEQNGGVQAMEMKLNPPTKLRDFHDEMRLQLRKNVKRPLCYVEGCTGVIVQDVPIFLETTEGERMVVLTGCCANQEHLSAAAGQARELAQSFQ